MRTDQKMAHSSEKSSQARSQERSARPSAGPDGLSVAAPTYGIESIDQPVAESTPEAERASNMPLQMQAGESTVDSGAGTPLPNRTGLPDTLKSGVEALSGFSLDDVRVHYNSSGSTRYEELC